MEPPKHDPITTLGNLRDYREVPFFGSFKGSGSLVDMTELGRESGSSSLNPKPSTQRCILAIHCASVCGVGFRVCGVVLGLRVQGLEFRIPEHFKAVRLICPERLSLIQMSSPLEAAIF